MTFKLPSFEPITLNTEATTVFYGENKWIKLSNGYGTIIETALNKRGCSYPWNKVSSSFAYYMRDGY
jgi:hypothetical protein